MWARKISVLLVVAVWLFIGGFVWIKGLTTTLWLSGSTIKCFSIVGSDNRSILMVFLPNNEVMMWYHNPSQQVTEGVLTKMRGSYAQHYFGRLWRLNGPGVVIGFRIYPPDSLPVEMEIETLDRVFSGKGKAAFGDIGEKSYQVILFSEEALRFQGMWFKEIGCKPDLIAKLRLNFERHQ